jgi:hypothetical protein
VVVDTRSIQAVDSSGNPITGLTWTSSNTDVATLSTDDPPIVTAQPGQQGVQTDTAVRSDTTA